MWIPESVCWFAAGALSVIAVAVLLALLTGGARKTGGYQPTDQTCKCNIRPPRGEDGTNPMPPSVPKPPAGGHLKKGAPH